MTYAWHQQKAALEAELAEAQARIDGLEGEPTKALAMKWKARAEKAEAELATVRGALDGIASPLHIDGENHMAAVKHARAALAALPASPPLARVEGEGGSKSLGRDA
jgi:hypothetical protein